MIDLMVDTCLDDLESSLWPRYIKEWLLETNRYSPVFFDEWMKISIAPHLYQAGCSASRCFAFQLPDLSFSRYFRKEMWDIDRPSWKSVRSEVFGAMKEYRSLRQAEQSFVSALKQLARANHDLFAPLEKLFPYFVDGQFIYYLSAESHVKLGISVDPTARNQTIKTSSPMRTYLTNAWYVGTDRYEAMQIERAIHSQLAEYRHHGEWYHKDTFSPQDVALIIYSLTNQKYGGIS